MRFPPNQLLLYKLFLSYPDRSFYMQEIGRILGKKPGVFQRTLYNLESDGFVKSTFKANARFFYLNKDYKVLKELQGIIRKTSQEVNIFKKTIKEMDGRHKKQKRLRHRPKAQTEPVPDKPAPVPIPPAARPQKAKPQARERGQLELF